MQKILLSAILLLALGPVAAEIYKHVGPDGAIIYSDRPEQGSEPLNLPGLNRFASPRRANSGGSAGPASDAQAATTYRSVRILQPTQDQTVQHNGGRVNVSLLLEPALRPGNGIRIILNGFTKPEPINATQFILADMNRGTNTLQVEVVDTEGQVLGQSETVSFNVFQPSVAGQGSTDNGSSSSPSAGPSPGVPLPPGGTAAGPSPGVPSPPGGGGGI
ncbi:MAG: DUF4124 domain-containing protein [Chromatiales bacterium]|nr:DUF4124 domain-containing protein [Chromatiales bacterium]